jgi:preprotein translocase subunit SecA
MVMLQMIDKAWKNHLYDLDHLKKAIFLRSYAQKDPKVEYQKESFRYFEALLGRVREQTVEYVFRVEAPKAPPPPPEIVAVHAHAPGETAGEDAPVETTRAARPSAPRSILSGGGAAPSNSIQSIGRNDPCYCGSGKKYKKCHGADSL